MRCGEVVWERGLAKKGCGLCHGTAGNGFTFLQLFRLTAQPQYVARAVKVGGGGEGGEGGSYSDGCLNLSTFLSSFSTSIYWV